MDTLESKESGKIRAYWVKVRKMHYGAKNPNGVEYCPNDADHPNDLREGPHDFQTECVNRVSKGMLGF